jgi:ribosome biogenesis GTP-binding protein YsxC/EngB
MKVSTFSLVFQIAWFACISNLFEGYRFYSRRIFSVSSTGILRDSEISPRYARSNSEPWRPQSSSSSNQKSPRYARSNSEPWRPQSSSSSNQKRKVNGPTAASGSRSPPVGQLDPQQLKKRSFSLAKRDIQGREILICRPFSIDSRKTFTTIGSYTSVEEIPTLSLPEIAFVGRSNVGKSSLINCLTGLNKKIAKTSKTPGRTQSVNLLKCHDGKRDVCVFTDLPGYGFANISKQKQEDISRFVQDYLLKRVALRLCVVLLDARRDPQVSDYNTLKVSFSC